MPSADQETHFNNAVLVPSFAQGTALNPKPPSAEVIVAHLAMASTVTKHACLEAAAAPSTFISAP